LRPFKIIRILKLFGMRPNFEVRPGAVTHLALAQGHPCIGMNFTMDNFLDAKNLVSDFILSIPCPV
jgi:hypothetical protein